MNAKRSDVLRLFLVALLLAIAPLAIAQDDDDDDADFTPRTGTPPAKRTGGASRHLGAADLPRVSILAPAETLGLTGRERPVIYWHLSKATDAPIEVGINKGRSTVLELTLEGKKKAGLHALDLRKLEQDGEPVKLEFGVEYDVVVGLATDQRDPSKNSVATARIMRVDPQELPDAAKAHDDRDDAAKLAPVLAKEGLWFDYLDALNRALKTRAKNEGLQKKRAKLLSAEGLELKPDGTLVETPSKEGGDAPK